MISPMGSPGSSKTPLLFESLPDYLIAFFTLSVIAFLMVGVTIKLYERCDAFKRKKD